MEYLFNISTYIDLSDFWDILSGRVSEKFEVRFDPHLGSTDTQCDSQTKYKYNKIP